MSSYYSESWDTLPLDNHTSSHIATTSEKKYIERIRQHECDQEVLESRISTLEMELEDSENQLVEMKLTCKSLEERAAEGETACSEKVKLLDTALAEKQRLEMDLSALQVKSQPKSKDSFNF